MAALPGTGALQCSGHDQLLAGLQESERVILPGLLVEVSRKEPTGFVWQEWINANGLLAQKVIFDDHVSQWEESSCLSVDSLPLFRTASVDRFPIFHGCRRVPRPFSIPLPAPCVNILSPSKQTAEKHDSLFGALLFGQRTECLNVLGWRRKLRRELWNRNAVN